MRSCRAEIKNGVEGEWMVKGLVSHGITINALAGEGRTQPEAVRGAGFVITAVARARATTGAGDDSTEDKTITEYSTEQDLNKGPLTRMRTLDRKKENEGYNEGYFPLRKLNFKESKCRKITQPNKMSTKVGDHPKFAKRIPSHAY